MENNSEMRERIAEIVEMVANYYFYKRVPPSNVPAMNKDDAMNKLYALLTPSVEGKHILCDNVKRVEALLGEEGKQPVEGRCPICKGAGSKLVLDYALETHELKCPSCSGRGYISFNTSEPINCSKCDGTGKVEGKQPTSEACKHPYGFMGKPSMCSVCGASEVVEWPKERCPYPFKEKSEFLAYKNGGNKQYDDGYNQARSDCLSPHQQILAQKDEAWRKKENEIITHYETKIDDCRIRIEQKEKEIAELKEEIGGWEED